MVRNFEISKAWKTETFFIMYFDHKTLFDLNFLRAKLTRNDMRMVLFFMTFSMTIYVCYGNIWL